jgi:hypothetical protein
MMERKPPGLVVLTGPTIRKGESLSDALDCSLGQLMRVTMPLEWTDAPVTFQISTDGVSFNDVFGFDGYEVTLPVVVPRTAVIVPNDVGQAINFIKFRSGTRSDPINQDADRTFAVAINPLGI